MHVVTELDPLSGALFARNLYSPEFARPSRLRRLQRSNANRDRAIAPSSSAATARRRTPRPCTACGCPAESVRDLTHVRPCRFPIALADGQEKEIVFILGAARSEEASTTTRSSIPRRRRAPNGLLKGVWHYWSRTLGAVYCETPDPAVNFLANGWLIYQALACRMWARTGFYQSGGAFGFRDQLQDAMALVHAEPGLLREHLLRAAAHQFREGDVQHWWHPPAGRGVRTHFSDDYLWLPYATCRYVSTTGDTGVLDERVPFLRARLVRPEEEAYYDLPQVSDDVGTLYEHCVRAHRQRPCASAPTACP